MSDFDRDYPALKWALDQYPAAKASLRARWRAARNLSLMLAAGLLSAWAVTGVARVAVRSVVRTTGTVTESLTAWGVRCDRIYGGWFGSDAFRFKIVSSYADRFEIQNDLIHEMVWGEGLSQVCAEAQWHDCERTWAKRHNDRAAQTAAGHMRDSPATATDGGSACVPGAFSSPLSNGGIVTLTGNITGTSAWTSPPSRLTPPRPAR